MTNTKQTTLKQIKEIVSADQISRQKGGSIVFRDEYFYRHGRTAEGFRDKVSAALNTAGINHRVEDCGDHWAPFRGGASTAKSSHFYVRVKLIDTKIVTTAGVNNEGCVVPITALASDATKPI